MRPLIVFAALLLGGCGISSVNDLTTGAAKLSAGEDSGLATPRAGAGTVDTAAVRKTADDVVAVASPGSAAYKIGPLDVLEVTVFKVPDLSKTVQVSDTGTISYPLLGEVQAAGLTAREVETKLTKDLGAKYLQKPQVSVFVKEYNSQRVTIEGAVKKPGVYPIQGGLTLLQVLAVAQGLDPNSDDTIIVFRQSGAKRSAARFLVSDLRAGNAKDLPLQAGDVIVANSSAIKEGFNTLMKALPLAGVFALL